MYQVLCRFDSIVKFLVKKNIYIMRQMANAGLWKGKKLRTILHSDLDNFYASVELLRYPDLRDKPIAVCGDIEERHGVVLAKNLIAKKAGVATGDVIWQAKKKCPDLIELPAKFSDYLRVSKAVRKIYERYTDRIEAFGIDECWLDVTDSVSMFGGGEKIARAIQQSIKEEIGITASIGISWNKIFAKLGSDVNKPDGIFQITLENYKNAVWNLPCDKLLYVGKVTAEKLRRQGINTIGEIAQSKKEKLVALLGKWGEYLHTFANGNDLTTVLRKEEERNIKSIGNSLTNYRDLEDEDDVKILIYLLSDSVASRLQDAKFGCAACIKINIIDSQLNRYSKQGKPLNAVYFGTDIAEFALQLFRKVYPWNFPVRGVGVSVSEFTFGTEQMDIFFDKNKRERDERLEKALKNLRKKYGNTIVQRATILKDERLCKMDIREEHVIRPENFFGKQ